ALVDHHQPLPVALLVEHTDVRLLQPRRHLPVNRTDVVAGPVVPDLLEVQPAPTYSGGIAARQQALHRLARQERHAAAAPLEHNQTLEVDIDTSLRSVWHDCALMLR